MKRSAAALAVMSLLFAGPGHVVDTASAGPVAPDSRKAADPSAEHNEKRVNPLTGKSLALEEKSRLLEESRLDEQLKASELNRKKAEAEIKRLEAEMSMVTRPVLTTGPVPMPAEPLAVQPASTTIGFKPTQISNPLSASSSPRAGASQRALPKVVGVIRTNEKSVALLEYGGKVTLVSVGETVGGRRIEGITDSNVTMNGATYPILQAIPRVETTDHPRQASNPGQPSLPTLLPSSTAGGPKPLTFEGAMTSARDGLNGLAIPDEMRIPAPTKNQRTR